MSAPRSRSGEIGIRTRLKIWRGHTHVGSSPTSGTKHTRILLNFKITTFKTESSGSTSCKAKRKRVALFAGRMPADSRQ